MKNKNQENLTTYIGKTLYGLEHILAQELLKLGAQNIKIGNRMVFFDGDLGFLYKANLNLRTCLRVLYPIADFEFESIDEFYNQVYAINWSSFFKLYQSFKIDSVVFSDHFTHTNFASLKAKDAIVDKFKYQFRKRPNVETKNPDVIINLHVNRNKCTISLDSSGESLHKRGYKIKQTEAPMNEVLAAALIKMTGWKDDAAFVDPMCGSGTLLIEAAMIAANVPANILRDNFAFKNWYNFNEELYNTIKEGALKRTKEPRCRIIGYDISKEAVEITKINATKALMEDYIEVEHKDFFISAKPFGPTMLLFNPPYNERLLIKEQGFYKNIGDTLKNSYTNAIAWLITSNFEALKSVGLRTSARIPLKNAKLDCKLVRYDLYEGTKKIHKIKD